MIPASPAAMLALAVATWSHAPQASASFAIPVDAVGAGVGAMASANHRLRSTIGGLVADGGGSPGYTLQPGFQAQLARIAVAAVSVTRDGTGSGAVASSPAGIDCGATCAADFALGTSLSLVATASAGSTFASWTGCDSASGSECALTVDQSRSVTATFTLNAYAITAAANPVAGGTVGCVPNPVSHGGTSICTASANTGYVFTGFSGDCTGSTCTLSDVTAARSVTATFTPSTYAITATALPPAGGTVTCTPNPVAHGGTSTCTATANAGYAFSAFSGDCAGPTCTLSDVTAARSVTATFVAEAGSLALSANPASLAFGGQSMGTNSPAEAITVTNTGNGTVSISGVASSNAQFMQANDCTTLAVGASCTVSVTFSPAISAGTLLSTVSANGSLIVTSNAATSPNAVPLSGTAEKSLVSHYYRSILRRAPDAGGKSFWEAEAARVQALGLNVNEVWFAMAGSFFASAEYQAFGRDDVGFATDLYNTFFNRPPDGAGLAYWTGQLAGGLPREVALVAFMFSAEFVNFTQSIFDSAAVRAEVDTVTDFYRGLLARLPDDGGFAFWLARFRAAQCLGGNAVNTEVESISSLFANSAEYAARARSNAQFVGDLYNAFLRRSGDLAGVLFWIGELSTGARTRENVRQAFVASPEFQARVAAVIAAGCVP
ncbi:MAG: DUF4214 domain-containing protein [Burkholderiales bacterium]|nr:DUF4214 domain-containing protein [Burkholderiales bacterium]